MSNSKSLNLQMIFQTFVVLALFMNSMRKLAVVPYAMKSRAETVITLNRIKVFCSRTLQMLKRNYIDLP